MTKQLNLNVLLETQVSNSKLFREPRVLTIDIETSPHTLYSWGMFNQDHNINQLIETSRVLCFAAKWHNEKKVMFFSEQNVGREAMIKKAWELFNEADIVIGYNSIAFDIKHLQREFIELGLTPPSPFKNVDLLKTARNKFKFPSNKLDYVGQVLGLGQKIKHAGFDLWKRIIEDNELKAWKEMEKYNVQDVRLTEAVFDYLSPWIVGLPHKSLYTGEYGCAVCGSINVKQSGWYQTTSNVYVRLCCEDCGAWSRGNTGKNRLETKAI